MEDETKRQDLEAHLGTEYCEEIRLSGGQEDGQLSFVSVREVLLQSHDNTAAQYSASAGVVDLPGGDDGGKDGPLKGGPLDDEDCESAEDVVRAEEEE